MPRTPARWTVSVRPETDAALRAFIGARGARKGDLSRFIEEAVLWRMLDEACAKAREGFTDLADEQVQRLVDEACSVAEVQMFPRQPVK